MEAEKKPKKKPKTPVIILISILLLIALLFLDSRFRVVVTEYELYFDKLPESFDGFKIVELSDLHLAQYGEDNSRILELVAAQKPDIITLNGDFIEKRNGMTSGAQTALLAPFLQSLAELAPCYFVSGNHEWASGELPQLAKLLAQLGIKYLRNEFVLLGSGEDELIIAGVEDPNGSADMLKPDELVNIIRKAYPERFTILLGHRSNWLEKYPDLEVDIIFCGHAHGGVLRLPFVGGVFGTDMELFPEYDAGIYDEGGYKMVLSRGLGGSVPMPRFLNNPEIVSVTLRAK